MGYMLGTSREWEKKCNWEVSMLMKLDLLTHASTFCSRPIHPGSTGGSVDAMLLALASLSFQDSRKSSFLFLASHYVLDSLEYLENLYISAFTRRRKI